MPDNKKIAQDVLEAVGGKENVTSATHCMTRLRLTLKDFSIPDTKQVEKIKGVLGVRESGGQYQVIIGQNVPKVYDEFCGLTGIAKVAAVDENLDAPKEKLTPKLLWDRTLDYLSGSMTQLIPVIMAASLFRTIAVVLGPQILGLVTEKDPTYTFFYTTMFEAGFYFLPIFLGYACAKRIGASPVLGMLTGGVLLAPSIETAAAKGQMISVYGFQIPAADYSQTVLPILLSVVFLYFVEKWMKRVIPDVLSTVFTPFLTMVIVVPVSLIVFAPIGNEVGQLLSGAIFGLADMGGIAKIAVMGVLGAFWQLFVVAGMHLPIVMVAQVQILQAGYDPFLLVATNCAMVAVWGCAFGSFLRIRNKEEKGLALSYFIAGFVGGVTEPALFGTIMRFRRTMLGMFAGGAVGGIISGIRSSPASAA